MTKSDGGYSLVELALVIAIVGILTALATPSFLTYYQAAVLRSAAAQVATVVNQGRQLGIKENTGVCVHIASTAVQYKLGTSCGGAAWTGPGTDASGNTAAPTGVTLSTTADPVFGYLGEGRTGGSITVTNAQTGATLFVCVAVSGRVSVRDSCS